MKNILRGKSKAASKSVIGRFKQAPLNFENNVVGMSKAILNLP